MAIGAGLSDVDGKLFNADTLQRHLLFLNDLQLKVVNKL